jgi:hypothetical protein
MEFSEELFPESSLPEFKTILASLVPIDLSEWNVDRYYEAVGLDFVDEEDVQNENDHQ